MLNVRLRSTQIKEEFHLVPKLLRHRSTPSATLQITMRNQVNVFHPKVTSKETLHLNLLF